MNLHNQDWAFWDRYNRIQRLQQQNCMEVADEELPRGGNPLATAAAIVLICTAFAITFHIVLTLTNVINNTAIAHISTAPSHTAIILHEQERGER